MEIQRDLFKTPRCCWHAGNKYCQIPAGISKIARKNCRCRPRDQKPFSAYFSTHTQSDSLPRGPAKASPRTKDRKHFPYGACCLLDGVAIRPGAPSSPPDTWQFPNDSTYYYSRRVSFNPVYIDNPPSLPPHGPLPVQPRAI